MNHCDFASISSAMMSVSFKRAAALAVRTASTPTTKRLLRTTSRTACLVLGESIPRVATSLNLRTMSLHTSRSMLKGVTDDSKDVHAVDVEGDEDEDDEIEDSDNNDADDDADEGVASETYTGVTYHESRVKKWSASVTVGNIEVDAGKFWTEEDAAKGYDELVRMYLEPGAAALHFPDGHPDDVDNASNDASSLSHEWNLPDAGSRHADIIPPIQKYVDME
ncbi:hypothetical protein DYB35_007413 [Aphanomyces astaci]|uniref:AP2/ERF domain-containing protein n=1 Tax=Aphanomyces astaci TaxID=112090 RepID=A0A3R6WLH5_APHAT|nr:hypothetical protein DYB35_007413 [Aphanomyces astaci]